MKILQINYNLGAGGAERFVVDLSNELCKKNDVVICTILDDSNYKNIFHKQFLSPKVKYINLGCKKGLCLKSVIGIIKVIKQEKPDVVHGHQVSPLLILPSFIFPKIRFITTLHNLAEKCLSFKGEKKINKYLFKNKRIIPVTISDICYDSFVNLYGIKSAHKIDNGRTLPEKTDKFELVRKEIASLKKTDHDLVFIHVARFCPQKNQDLLIDVFNKLYNKNLILIVLGEKFDTTGKYLVEKSKEHIHFLGAKNNVADYLLNSDFFCLTSLWEGLPISLLEAIACKVIPICTPVGGIPNVIQDNVTGFLSKDCNYESYMETVLRAIKNRNNINRGLLQKEYLTHFSMESCVNKYYNIYING